MYVVRLLKINVNMFIVKTIWFNQLKSMNMV